MSGTFQLRKWKKDKKNIKWNSFFFNLCLLFVSLNVVLPCMTSEKGENFTSGVNTIISLAYIKQSWVSLWETQQNNLSNPGVYSEAWVECYIKIIIFFIKHFILDVWQNSEYVSVICYSLFWKIEGTNKIDLVVNFVI